MSLPNLAIKVSESYGTLATLAECPTPMTPGTLDDYAFFRSFVAEQAAKDPEIAAALAQLEQTSHADNKPGVLSPAPAASSELPEAVRGAAGSSQVQEQDAGLTGSVDAVVHISENGCNDKSEQHIKKPQLAAAYAGATAPSPAEPQTAAAPPAAARDPAALASRPSRSALIKPDFTRREIKSLRRIFPIASPAVKSAAALQGEYQLLDLLGRGAFGTAYKARQLSSGNLVCIKTVEAAAGQGTADLDRQKREVAVLAALKHPNIIRYHDCFSDGSKLHIVMEWAEGGDVQALISKHAKAGTRLAEDQLLTYFVQIVAALAHIHAAGVMHRDLKTSNILFSGSGLLKLADFGIAKVLDAPANSNCGSRGTSGNGGTDALVPAAARSGPMAQSFVGTPNYLAPEMINCEPYNQKADVWAAGCLLYEMAALRPAFRADRIPLVYRLIRRGRTSPLPSCYSTELKALVQRLMSQDPNDRPSSAQLLQEGLLRPYYERYQQQLDQLGLQLPALPTPPAIDSISGTTSSNGGYSNNVSISGVVTSLQQQQQPLEDALPTAAAAADRTRADLHTADPAVGSAAGLIQQQQQGQSEAVQAVQTDSATLPSVRLAPRVSLLSVTGLGSTSPIAITADGGNSNNVLQFTSYGGANLGTASRLGTRWSSATAGPVSPRHRQQEQQHNEPSTAGIPGILELLPVSNLTSYRNSNRNTKQSVMNMLGARSSVRVGRIRRTTHLTDSMAGSNSGRNVAKPKGFVVKLHMCLRKVFKGRHSSSGGAVTTSTSGLGCLRQKRLRRRSAAGTAAVTASFAPDQAVYSNPLAAAGNSIGTTSGSSISSSLFGSIAGDFKRVLPLFQSKAVYHNPPATPQQPQLRPQAHFFLQNASRYIRRTINGAGSDSEQSPESSGAAVVEGSTASAAEVPDRSSDEHCGSLESPSKPRELPAAKQVAVLATESAATAPPAPGAADAPNRPQPLQLEPHELLHMHQLAAAFTAQQNVLAAERSGLSTITERSESTTAISTTFSLGAYVYSSQDAVPSALSSPREEENTKSAAVSLNKNINTNEINHVASSVNAGEANASTIGNESVNATAEDEAAVDNELKNKLQQEQLIVLSSLRTAVSKTKLVDGYHELNFAQAVNQEPQAPWSEADKPDRVKAQATIVARTGDVKADSDSSKQPDAAAVVRVAARSVSVVANKLQQEQLTLLSGIRQLRSALGVQPRPSAVSHGLAGWGSCESCQ